MKPELRIGVVDSGHAPAQQPQVVAGRMFALCYGHAPELFEDAGAGCLRGACPEGDKTCGKAAQVRAERKAFLDAQK